MWLAELDGRPVGTVQTARSAEEGLLHNLGVVPEFRGQGLGKRLVGQALEAFRGAGVRRVALEVSANNPGAVRMYKRLGFRRVEVLYRPRNGSPP